MSTQPSPPPSRPGSEQHQNIAAAIAEVSDRASVLIREEIELAKVEVTEKAGRLLRGAIVGVAAGVFVVLALLFALVGCAWLLYYYLPGSDFTYFWGFFAMAVILLLLGGIAGLVAAKAVKKFAPPVPSMAIDEARKIRETVSSATEAPLHDGPARSVASEPPPVAPVAPVAAEPPLPEPPATGGTPAPPAADTDAGTEAQG